MAFLPCLYRVNSRIRCEMLLRIIVYRHYCDKKFNFPERTVQIQTCGQLYKTWKKEKVFWKLPKSDLTFNVKFIDTRPDSSKESRETPTVLALHGAPGSWRDYMLLSSYFNDRGCRVIVPSFPDFHMYKPGIFKHTDLEKAQYIKDFLASISVSHIDLLVCHSGSVYPGLNLCLSNELKIKSLTLINPGTFNVKGMNATKHLTALKTMLKIVENPIGLKFMEVFGPFMMKNILKVPVKFENVLDPLLSAETMVNGNIVGSKEKFLQVSKKLPILYIFSENDVLISKMPSYELAKFLGACESDISIYNKQGILVQKGTATPMLKVIAFQEGSHYAFLKHPEIVNKEIADFLESQK